MRNSIFIVCFGRHNAGKCNVGPLSTYFHSWTQSKAAVQPVKATKSNEHHAVDEISEEWKTAKPFEQIPSHPSYPFFGTAWVFLPLIGKYPGVNVRDQPIDLYRIGSKALGPIWKENIPKFPPLVISTRPEDAEKLFRNEGKYPERVGFRSLTEYRAERVKDYATGGLLIDNGEKWWKVRSKAQQPFLKTKNVANYVPILGKISDEFIDRIRLTRQSNNEMKPNFMNDVYRWALESVGVIGLNTRLGCLNPVLASDSEAQKMIDAANTTFEKMADLEMGLPIRNYLVGGKDKKELFQAQDFFTETSIKYINKTLEDIKNRPADSDEDPSILEELLIRGMPPEEAIVMVVDMLMAGIDSTSHSVGFLLYLLAKNSEKQEKLRKEILSVVGSKGSPITSGALNELHYLKACIKESMRILPVVLGTTRILDKDIVLSGYRVPKGACVIIPHQLMGEMDEYFSRPKEFIPERWIKGDPQESHHHPYTLLPFGFGTRMCIGRRLAELEIYQLTAKVMQNFRIEYHHKDINIKYRLVNIPDQPLRLKFIDLP